MTRNEIFSIAEAEGLQVQFRPVLTVPAPRRWAYVAQGHAHVIFILEPEVRERRRAARDSMKRWFQYRITAHTVRGPIAFEGRVRAMSPGAALYSAMREVKARPEIRRRRIARYDVALVPVRQGAVAAAVAA